MVSICTVLSELAINMAGKTKKPAATKENRGGKRAGSGRKSLLAKWDSNPKDMVKAAQEYAKEQGRSIDDVLLDIIYHAPVVRDRLAAIKVFKEFTIAKVSESKVEVTKKQAPKIYLPERKPDPAKVVPINKKIGGKSGKKIAR